VNADAIEANLSRAATFSDRLFEILEDIEAAGGLAPALAGRGASCGRPAQR